MPVKRPPIKIKEKKLGRERAWGLCYSDGLIEIDPRMKSKKYLVILIHELLHHLEPGWSENKVDKTSIFLGNIIWEKNYRRIQR